MDAVDAKIIGLLRTDARMPFLEIARRIKLSEGAVRKRVNGMAERKEIARFTVETQSAGIGAVSMIKLDPGKEAMEIVKNILKIGEVDKILEVSGKFDAIALSSSKDVQELNSTLDKIRMVKGVLETESFTVLKTSTKGAKQ